jgi:hypothetical protein
MSRTSKAQISTILHYRLETARCASQRLIHIAKPCAMGVCNSEGWNCLLGISHPAYPSLRPLKPGKPSSTKYFAFLYMYPNNKMVERNLLKLY